MAEKVLKALGDRVIIRFEKIEQKKRVTAGGIELIGGKGEEVMHEAIVETIGNNVDLETCGFKIGDSIIFNDYSIKQFDVPDVANPMEPTRKGIIGVNDVWGIYS